MDSSSCIRHGCRHGYRAAEQRGGPSWDQLETKISREGPSWAQPETKISPEGTSFAQLDSLISSEGLFLGAT